MAPKNAKRIDHADQNSASNTLNQLGAMSSSLAKGAIAATILAVAATKYGLLLPER